MCRGCNSPHGRCDCLHVASPIESTIAHTDTTTDYTQTEIVCMEATTAHTETEASYTESVVERAGNLIASIEAEIAHIAHALPTWKLQ